LAPGLYRALDELEKEAELYVHGNRAQTNLFATQPAREMAEAAR
jgi:hypothetical protein